MEALNTLADLDVEVWDYSTGQQVDLESFEGETLTFSKHDSRSRYREHVRKHTREAMPRKAGQGRVTGRRVFGYPLARLDRDRHDLRPDLFPHAENQSQSGVLGPAGGVAASAR